MHNTPIHAACNEENYIFLEMANVMRENFILVMPSFITENVQGITALFFFSITTIKLF